MILSNCVINLVPDKAQVFREAFRVLKPGGRLAISDVVNTGAAAGRAAGRPRAALRLHRRRGAGRSETETWLAEAGFVDVRVTPKAGKPRADQHLGARPRHRGFRRLGDRRRPQAGCLNRSGRSPDQARGIHDIRCQCGPAPRGAGAGHLRALPDLLGGALHHRRHRARPAAARRRSRRSAA